MKKTIEILVGIPCSGKSSYVNRRLSLGKLGEQVALSRDEYRLQYLPKNYKHNSKDEDWITEIYNLDLQNMVAGGNYDIILDNTHCKEKYIDEIIKKYSAHANIKVIFFDISLIESHIRNVLRYIKTGKWIPIAIINSMYKNYNKLNRMKYGKYK